MTKNYIPDGSGTVIINICDSNGNIINTTYKNLSDFAASDENAEQASDVKDN